MPTPPRPRGRFHEATPEATAWYHSLLPGSTMKVFEESAHLPHLEEAEHYTEAVRTFLHEREA